MNYSNWKIEECPTDKLKMFTDAGYPALLAALLSVRGLGSVQEAKSFLDGGAELLCDPLLMKDMDRAAARIRRALSMRETVAVYGDYDVDGITSTCLLTDSPSIRPTARMQPVMMPSTQPGKTTVRITRHLPAPRPNAPSRRL